MTGIEIIALEEDISFFSNPALSEPNKIPTEFPLSISFLANLIPSSGVKTSLEYFLDLIVVENTKFKSLIALFKLPVSYTHLTLPTKRIV